MNEKEKKSFLEMMAFEHRMSETPRTEADDDPDLHRTLRQRYGLSMEVSRERLRMLQNRDES